MPSDRAGVTAAKKAGWDSWHDHDDAGIGAVIDRMADAMLDALRSLPVEQRMEAMGMECQGRLGPQRDLYVVKETKP